MAKTDNLTDFLTGVADAIRMKKGTTEKINPQNFETEIGSIDGNKFIALVRRTIEMVTEDDLFGVTSIGDYIFYTCNKLTDITIPNSVTSIGYHAFDRCRLTTIAIPNSVTSIGDGAFEWCSTLTNVTIGNNVTSISEGVFYGCVSLTNVTIPDSVISIGNSAFFNCNRLTTITIPNSVTSIGNSVFKECDGLTSVTMLPTTPPTLGSDVFPSNVTTIIVPVGCGNAYKAAEGWSVYADKIVEATV